jgi:hypothetical protein
MKLRFLVPSVELTKVEHEFERIVTYLKVVRVSSFELSSVLRVLTFVTHESPGIQ